MQTWELQGIWLSLLGPGPEISMVTPFYTSGFGLLVLGYRCSTLSSDGASGNVA